MKVLISLTSLLMLALAGCATSPERVALLETAEDEVRRVQQMEDAREIAGSEIASAENALATAREIHEDGGDVEDVRYHARLAQRHAEIAAARISTRHTQQAIEDSERMRTQLLLQARELEAQRNERLAERRAAEATMQRQRAEEAMDMAEEQRRRARAAVQTAEELSRELEDVKAEQTNRGLVLTLSDVLFDTAEADLKSGAANAIDQVAGLLGDYPERNLRIEGHTDSRGSDAYNEKLSERRAEAVEEALLRRGISPDRLQTVGLGEEYPVATNDTAAGRQQNRRVEIIISDPDGGFPAAADRTAASVTPAPR